MIDEVEIYSRLESALYGSLVHAASISAPIIRADVAAIRLFEGLDGALSSYVQCCRLGLSAAEEEVLAGWPKHEDSVFEYARRSELFDQVFRPRQLVDELEYAKVRFFRPLEIIAPVTDSLCITFPVLGSMWCMVAYLRCGLSPAFTDQQVQLLERLKPALARVVRNGYDHETHRRLPGVAGVPKSVTAAALLAKLSRTERLVLNYLRSDTTERQIAQTIHRSPHTIHAHVKNIYRKLGVSSRRELISLFDQPK